jgi:hypothetical protein
MVPTLLLIGNKEFGISSSLRHICAAALPARKGYFAYNWRDYAWNLLLVVGVIIGGVIAAFVLNGDSGPDVSKSTVALLDQWNVAAPTGLQPAEIFSASGAFSARGLISLVAGGFLVGFGTRYANGCTAGHAIMGLSILNVGSIVATFGFLAGGILVSNFVLPWVMSL